MLGYHPTRLHEGHGVLSPGGCEGIAVNQQGLDHRADLPKLVGIHQGTFIQWHSIHDNFIMVQGTARRLHALRSPAIMLKLDISKAFDTVQWPFIVEVLSRLDFSPRWVGWICALLQRSSTHVLINGVPGVPIYPRAGLRQGDPISPMIFILVMEILHRLFSRATSVGLLEQLANRALQQRISMFANDVMLLVRPREVELRTCAEILHDFGIASGLRVNFQKSATLPIRCSPKQV